MAKVTGPLMSVSASGTVAKTLTFGTWKGIQWVREYFIPSNPNTEEQQNVRKAFSLTVELYNGLSDTEKAQMNEAAATLDAQSGISLFMRRGLKAYGEQLGSATEPDTVTVSGMYPDDVWTWTAV